MPSTIAPPAEQLEPTLRDVLNAVNGLGTKVGSLETKVDSLGSKVDSLETKVDSVETRVGSLETKVDSVETRLGSLETKVDSVEAKVDSVETKVVSLEAKVDSVETKVDSLKADIYEVAEETAKHIISAISVAKEELGGRFTRVEDGLTETRSGVASLRKMGEVSLGVQHDVEIMRRSLRHIEPHAEETLKLGRSNRDALQVLTADVAELDRKFEVHIADRDIHVPRPRTMPMPDAGPIAA